MHINVYGINIEKEKIIFPDEEDGYGQISYIFHLNGAIFQASLDLPNEYTFDSKVIFGRFQPKLSLLNDFKYIVKKISYDLGWYLSFDKIMYNARNGPGPDNFKILPSIPYDNELFKSAVKFLVNNKKMQDIRCLIRSSKVYEQVDISKIQ